VPYANSILPRISGLAVLAILPAGIAKAQDSSLWTPIDPADLKLTDSPKEPGGQAMVLDYRDETSNLQPPRMRRFRSSARSWTPRPRNNSCQSGGTCVIS
jgi:hypothetical protein